MMKKTKLSIVIVLLMVIVIGGIAFLNKMPINSMSQNNKVSYIESSSQLIVFTTLDQAIEYADNIVVGTVVMEDDFSNTISKYILSINTNLKGSIDTQEIDVYELKGELVAGKDYLLFLEELNNPLYSEYSYTSFEKSMITEINKGKILNANKLFNKETDLNKISKLISNSKAKLKINKKDYIVLNQLETMNNLVEESDYVLLIIPSETIEQNTNTTRVEAKVIRQYKGSDMDENISILLPRGIQKDKEYLIFLKEYDGAKLPTTRKGSIIESGTPEFDGALDLLNN